MWRHLQHLGGLRFFEAAARHLSFTRAADELCVTQAAVSHQIRGLEEALQLTLFERRPRQVHLTPAGERLAAVLSSSFDRIEQVLDELRRSQSSSLLLAVTPTFSTKWLVNRLPRFWDAHPDIELHLHHTVQPDVLARGQVDAAVIWSAARPERVWSQRLFGMRLTPVCAPALPRADALLDHVEALAAYPLLHEDSFDDWARWLAHAGARGTVDARRGPVIDDTNALLLAAMGGRGVALGRLELIDEDLRSGRLIAPFAQTIEADGAYWLITSPVTAEQARFQALAGFLGRESGT